MQQSVEQAGQLELFLDDGDQQVDRNGDPDLGFNGVLAGPEEVLDAEVLLDPFKEEFQLAAALAESADGGGGKRELVGQEDKILAGLRGVAANAAQVAGVILAAVMPVERDGLVGTNASLLVYLFGVHAAGVEVVLGACNKEISGQVDAIEPGIVEIAAIHDIVSAGLWNDLIEDVDVVHIASCDADKRGYVAAQIEQRVHLDSGLGGAKMRQWKQTQTQIDGGRVQLIRGGIEVHAKIFLRVELARLEHQPLRQLRIDAPVAAFVGFSKSSSGEQENEIP